MLESLPRFAASLTPEQRLLGVASVAALVLVFLPGTLKESAPKLGALILGVLKFRAPQLEEIRIGKIRLRDEARLRHTHIVGATGSGKTVLIEQLLYSDVARGLGALVIDPKGDREFYERLRSFCRSIGRESDLHLLSASHPDESVRWNPCRLGDVSELQSKFFNSSVYDHHFYAKAVELGLLRAFQNLCRDRGEGFDLHDLCKTLQGLASEIKDETLKGLFFDLNSLALSEWGAIFTGAQGENSCSEYAENGCSQNRSTQNGGAKREITLLDITRRNEILFVDLPTEAKKTQSQRIGRLLLQEITLLSGMRKNYPHLKGARPFSVYVDEFDAFATPAFATFLNKGRSSAFMIHLAHQTLSDLNQVSEAFAGQIMGNTNVRFVFRQDDPDDAETWARFFGTRSVVKTTFQTKDGSNTGMSSNREVLEFRIAPDTIKDLAIGKCVVSIKTERIFQELSIPHPDSTSKLWPRLPSMRGPLAMGSFKKPSLRGQDVPQSRNQPVRKPLLEST